MKLRHIQQQRAAPYCIENLIVDFALKILEKVIEIKLCGHCLKEAAV